jgi:hypothetical protein
MERAACAHGESATRHAPSTGTGVVTFLWERRTAFVSGVADPFNGQIDGFSIAHVQRSDGSIETTWNNMSDPGTFAAAGAEEQEGRRVATARRRRCGRLPDGVRTRIPAP